MAGPLGRFHRIASPAQVDISVMRSSSSAPRSLCLRRLSARPLRAVLSVAVSVSLIGPGVALAEERSVLGWGRLFTNDALGDGQDRWHSGSYAVSYVAGPAWTGTLPTDIASVLEYRFRGEIIAPANLAAPAEDDRRYAGVLSFGVHTHWRASGSEASLGLDLVSVGKQTGVSAFHEDVHRALGMSGPSAEEAEIGNGIYPTVLLELGRRIPVSPVATVRPFMEAQAGVETYLRAGVDVILGRYWDNSLMLRDYTTGHLYRGVAGNRDVGTSFLLGADYAYVADTAYLPSGVGPDQLTDRTRLRAGFYHQGAHFGFFYGVTWLGEEFKGQDDDQVVGSIRLDIMF